MVNFDVLSTALIRKEVCFHSSFSLVRHHVDVAKIKNKSLKKSFFPNSFACKRLRERSQNLQTLQKHYTKANGIRILLQY
jgi:hypothetical protein